MSKPPAQHSCTEVANQKLSSLERR